MGRSRASQAMPLRSHGGCAVKAAMLGPLPRRGACTHPGFLNPGISRFKAVCPARALGSNVAAANPIGASRLAALG